MAGTVGAVVERKRILVIDDDPETGRMLSSWFRGRPYDILLAADGGDGLERARSENPDLILLDLRMPGDDGLTVARHLKADEATRATPVILLTACRDVDHKVRAFEIGADDYVTKPFSFEEMDARIHAMLRRGRLLTTLESTIEDLKHANAELEHLLTLDEKTGLYNFREFRRRLREEWSRAERYGAPLSLVLLDLDGFKRFNDTHGHPAGDAALVEFATLVAGGARTSDTAARYGGEEFAVILPHTDVAMAVRVAERIRRAAEVHGFGTDAGPQRLTVSAGVATFPTSSAVESADGLVREADRALYAAKAAGRNRVVAAPEAPAREIDRRAPPRTRRRGSAPRPASREPR